MGKVHIKMNLDSLNEFRFIISILNFGPDRLRLK